MGEPLTPEEIEAVRRLHPGGECDHAYDGCREGDWLATLDAARERDELREDAEKWRAAEAEGHVVDFTETGFGLQHPPSCRPDLIGCWYNVYLADLGYPDEEPGRYRMTRQANGVVEYALHREDGTTVQPPDDIDLLDQLGERRG